MEVIHYNNIDIIRFINSPVPSNAYLVIDRDNSRCIVIDPGSKKQDDIIEYIRNCNLKLDYIILTHEHFDHCWGVNDLLCFFNSKVVCSRLCASWIKTPMNYFNKLYYDSDEFFSIKEVDIIVEDIGMCLNWNGTLIKFFAAKGHSDKSICLTIGDFLFTGDTMIKDTKPFLKKKYGASLSDLKKTITYIFDTFPPDTTVLPGHGDSFHLKQMKDFYIDYFSE